MHAHLTQKINIIQIQKPVAVIGHDSLSFGKINQAGHLFFETGDIVVDFFFRQHFAHIRLSGRVADHSRSAAEQRDGRVPRSLHMRHDHNLHKVTDMQAVSRRIEPDIKRGSVIVEKILNFLLIRHLGN